MLSLQDPVVSGKIPLPVVSGIYIYIKIITLFLVHTHVSGTAPSSDSTVPSSGLCPETYVCTRNKVIILMFHKYINW